MKYSGLISACIKMVIVSAQYPGWCLPQSQPLVRASGYCGFILYYTLGHVGGGNSCGGHTLMRVATTCWLTGLWSTQAKVEGTVLKAAWYWGRDCSVVNDPLGEPGRTPLYVGLPSTWGLCRRWLNVFPLFCKRAPYWGLPKIYK
jgi:hypothetical protein